jgi:CRP/FNR family transcriptional regulator
VLLIEGRAFETLARSEPQILFDLLHLLSGRLKEAMQLIEALSLKDIPARIAAFLLHEAAAKKREQVVSLPLSHRELAKIVGVTPEALSRALKRMKEVGLVEVSGREIRLLDPAGLARCAETGLPPELATLPKSSA